MFEVRACHPNDFRRKNEHISNFECYKYKHTERRGVFLCSTVYVSVTSLMDAVQETPLGPGSYQEQRKEHRKVGIKEQRNEGTME